MKFLLISLLLITTASNGLDYYKIIPSSFIPGVQNFNLNLFGSVFALIANILNKDPLAPSWILESTKQHQSVLSTKPLRKSYDFVIVGAGSAGCVLANRISADSRVSVLLIEAGGFESIVTDTPGFYTLLRGTKLDWAYVTEPLKNAAFNMVGQRALMPKGRVMGGSSTINALVYTRGTAADYNNWDKLGAIGWSFKDVFPYFLRSENQLDPAFLANGFHSNSGPLVVASNVALSFNPMPYATVSAFNELGFPTIDLNGPTPVGGNYVQQHIVNGKRISVARAFLEPIIGLRKNLDVLDNSLVTKVLFSSHKRAIGVEIDRLGKLFTVGVAKEVILSAGTIETPHILLLSGIGPEQQLHHFRIPVVQHLAGVGENLQDHPYVLGPSFTIPSLGPLANTFEAFNDYIAKQIGPLGFLDQTVLQLNSTINNDYNWPDIQINAISPSYNNNPNQLNLEYGVTLSAWTRMFQPYVGRPSFFLRSSIARPKSRGTVRLRSKNPFDAPIIEANFLSHPDDVQVGIDGLKWQYRMAQTKAFKVARAAIFETLVAGCEPYYKVVSDPLIYGFVLPSDDYLECQTRSMITSGFHQTSTCAMGRKSDPMAVVDPMLRVYGVSGLRVIDTSVMPVIPMANVNAPTIMIAERGAQFIKDEYRLTDDTAFYY